MNNLALNIYTEFFVLFLNSDLAFHILPGKPNLEDGSLAIICEALSIQGVSCRSGQSNLTLMIRKKVLPRRSFITDNLVL